jgi:hypothetical protein
MISAWLDLSAIGVFACLALAYGFTTAAITWLTFRSPVRAHVQSLSGIVAPFFNAVAVLFALLTGFLAGDVMDRTRLAERAVHVESGALDNLNALALASATDTAAIREALRDYVDAVVNDEWARMAEGRNSVKTESALTALLRAIADPKVAPAASQAVHDGMVNLALKAAEARSDRIALNSRFSDAPRWATVLLLCLVTQLAIGMVHMERPRAHVAALTIFSLAAIVTLGLIAIQEYPFDGPMKVPPTPLEMVLKAAAT